jgi:hypothetical protein
MTPKKIDNKNLNEVLHHKKKQAFSEEINEELKNLKPNKKKVKKAHYEVHKEFIKENLKEIIPTEKKLEKKIHPYHEAPHNPRKGEHHIIHFHIEHLQTFIIFLVVFSIFAAAGAYYYQMSHNNMNDSGNNVYEDVSQNLSADTEELNKEDFGEEITEMTFEPEKVSLFIDEVTLSNKKIKSVSVKINNSGKSFIPRIVISVYDDEETDEALYTKEIVSDQNINGIKHMIFETHMDIPFSASEKERKVIVTIFSEDIFVVSAKRNDLFI